MFHYTIYLIDTIFKALKEALRRELAYTVNCAVLFYNFIRILFCAYLPKHLESNALNFMGIICRVQEP